MAHIKDTYSIVAGVRENIIKTMQQRRLKEIRLVMSAEEFCKKYNYDFESEEQWEDDYDDYKCYNATCVVHYDKWNNGHDYRVLKVMLEQSKTGTHLFRLECEDTEGREVEVFDEDKVYNTTDFWGALEGVLKIDDETEKVWVFTAEQAWDGETADIVVKTFKTRQAAIDFLQQFLHNGEDSEDGSILQAVVRRDWVVEIAEPTLYRACESGRFATDHIECTVTECELEG